MDAAVPARVREYADQVVTYVQRALGVRLEYDSDTLPLLDHYLRTVPELSAGQPATLKLVLATSGAYFGEVVRRRLGGRWEASGADEPQNGESERSISRRDARKIRSEQQVGEAEHPVDGEVEIANWRVILPTGLNFSPVGFVAAAIAQADLDDLDSELDAPPRMRPYVQQALQRMGEVSLEDYYSLCGRLDTLEHVHEILVAVAAQMMGSAADDDDIPELASDVPSGQVN